MARHVEPLNGGLVTNRDPALLSDGELSDLQNAVYKPASQALHRATGRTIFGQATAAQQNVVGIRDAHFDNGDHILVAHTNGAYLTADVGDTGTFGLLSAVGSGTQLERAHFRNRFYLLNGVSAAASEIGSNRVIYLSATAAGTTPSLRQHGMLPVATAPTISTAAGSFSQNEIVSGYYEYWTTEVAKLSADGSEFIMESAFDAISNPTTVFVSSTAVVPTIQRPAVINPITTHWRIYRSTRKDLERDKIFPTGFMIAELATGTTSQADTLTVATASAFPASFNTGSEPFSDFASASSVSADDGVFASATAGALTLSSQGCYGFNFGGIAGAVRGVTVEVQGYVSSGTAPKTIGVSIGRRRSDGGFQQTTLNGYFGPTISASKSATFTSTSAGSPTTVTLGGSTDKWFAPDQVGLNDSDFSATNLMVVLSTGISPTATIGIDYVKVTVHYAGAIDSVIPFPTVVYTLGDTTIQVAKNHPPPSASTADLYEDSMVLNDVSNPSLVRWSYPGDPEAFPPPFFVDIETEDNDRVTCIKTVNERCIVGTLNAVARLNYLPSELDSSFTPGKAKSWISRKFGIVNEMCACIYSPDGGAERLAFVSQKGIHDTDGFDFRTLMELDWRDIISTTSTSTPIALINDPENSELLFYYRNDSATENYKCLHLSYDRDHQKPGVLKASGLVHMRNWNSAQSSAATLHSAWAVPRSDGDTSIYLGYGSATSAGGGAVYRENGTAIPAQDPAMGYTTRRLYLRSFGGEWRLNELYEYGQITGTQIITFTGMNLLTNDSSGETNVEAQSITITDEQLYKAQFRQQAEGLRINALVASGHDARQVELLVLDGEDFGEEKSGL